MLHSSFVLALTLALPSTSSLAAHAARFLDVGPEASAVALLRAERALVGEDRRVARFLLAHDLGAIGLRRAPRALLGPLTTHATLGPAALLGLARLETPDLDRLAPGVPRATIPERWRDELAYREATAALRAGRPEHAASALDEVTPESPWSPYAGLLRAQAALALGRYDEAMRHVEATRQVRVPRPLGDRLQVWVAEALIELDRPEEALAWAVDVPEGPWTERAARAATVAGALLSLRRLEPAQAAATVDEAERRLLEEARRIERATRPVAIAVPPAPALRADAVDPALHALDARWRLVLHRLVAWWTTHLPGPALARAASSAESPAPQPIRQPRGEGDAWRRLASALHARTLLTDVEGDDDAGRLRAVAARVALGLDPDPSLAELHERLQRSVPDRPEREALVALGLDRAQRSLRTERATRLRELAYALRREAAFRSMQKESR